MFSAFKFITSHAPWSDVFHQPSQKALERGSTLAKQVNRFFFNIDSLPWNIPRKFGTKQYLSDNTNICVYNLDLFMHEHVYVKFYPRSGTIFASLQNSHSRLFS